MDRQEMQFEVRGPHSGSCGHRHFDFESALECLREHQAVRTAVGGFSDRQILPISASDVRRDATVAAIGAVAAMYRAGEHHAALAQLDALPDRIDELTGVVDVAKVERWIARARRRIGERPERHDPRAAAYLLAAANAVARNG
jgi:hypothetical protein